MSFYMHTHTHTHTHFAENHMVSWGDCKKILQGFGTISALKKKGFLAACIETGCNLVNRYQDIPNVTGGLLVADSVHSNLVSYGFYKIFPSVV